YQPTQPRASGSPAGGSILVTLAPRSRRRPAATGPGRLIARLTIFRPASGSRSRKDGSGMTASSGGRIRRGGLLSRYFILEVGGGSAGASPSQITVRPRPPARE